MLISLGTYSEFALSEIVGSPYEIPCSEILTLAIKSDFEFLHRILTSVLALLSMKISEFLLRDMPLDRTSNMSGVL